MGASRRRRDRDAAAESPRAFTLSQATKLAARRLRIPRLRMQQQHAIEALAAGRDVVLVQPTGSGKSLCYQLPAMLFGAPTVVVSPLLALMADQEAKLLRLDLPVSRVDSTVRAAARRQALWAISAGGPRVVLTTPETLESPELMQALARSGVALLAVDEAHCISEWGHDFRPAYLRIPTSIERLEPVRLMALTATATPRVRAEIAEALRMRDPLIISSPPHRPNLVLSVEQRRGTQKVERLGALVRKLPRPGIVYCATVESVERIAAGLRAARVPSVQYHGRMSAADRAAAQEKYMNLRRRLVMVATSAFGMGIDKPNIRYVVHYHAPGSLEQYVQEAGRAGRDGRPSRCILLFDPIDLTIQERLNAQARPRPEALARLTTTLLGWSEAQRPVDAPTLALSAQATAVAAKAVLWILEQRGLVARDGRHYRLVVSAEELRALGGDLGARFETLRHQDRQRLEKVAGYAATNECRSVFVRRYFGEEAPPWCGRCDRCVQAANRGVADGLSRRAAP